MIAQNIAVLIIAPNNNFTTAVEELITAIGGEVLATVNKIEAAVTSIQNAIPDLIILDTIFQEAKLKDKLTGIPTLLISKLMGGVNQLNKKEHLGYILKPINKVNLRLCIHQALQQQEKTITTSPKNIFTVQNSLFFKKKGIYQKVNLSDIYFFQSNGDYVILETALGRFTTNVRLAQLDKVLKEDFLRVHRSYIINLGQIDAMDLDNYQLMIREHQLPISRRTKNVLLERLNVL